MGKIGEGKFGKFGESLVIHQTRTIHNSTNLLADLLIRQTFLLTLKKSKFAKLFPTKLSHYTVAK